MKRFIPWIAVAAVLGGIFCAAKIWPEKVMFWKTSPAADAGKKPARPTTAVVTARDINFAISAAGEITPAGQRAIAHDLP